MKYELSSLERKVSPQQIKNAFARFNDTKNLKTRRITKQKTNHNESAQSINSQEDFHAFLEEFKKWFTDEVHRIQTAFNNHKIQDNPEVFSRYLATNYKGLTKLSNSGPVQKPPEPDFNSPELNQIPQQYATTHIYYHLQLLFVEPLREFIESDFKYELIENRLFESPVKVFFKAIKSSSVSVSRQADQVSEDYKAIYSPVSNHLFTLEYNGHREESLYGKSLEGKFEAFQNFIEDFLESPATVPEKMKYLNKLKIKITGLNDLFCEENTKNRKNHRPFRSHRIDAVGSLKHKLFHYKILPDLDEFHQELMQLTEIQNIYISRATKFVVAQIQFMKEYKGTAETVFPPKVNFLDGASESDSESYGKLQWMGNMNQLIAFFYDAFSQVLVNGEPILKATIGQLVPFLVRNFLQKDGQPLNPKTVRTILTPSKVSKRPPVTRRIIFPKE